MNEGNLIIKDISNNYINYSIYIEKIILNILKKIFNNIITDILFNKINILLKDEKFNPIE